MNFASLQDDGVTFRIRRQAAAAVFAPVLQDERNGRSKTKTIARLVIRAALAVRSRNVRAVRNHPVAVAFEQRRKLVVHAGSVVHDSVDRRVDVKSIQ